MLRIQTVAVGLFKVFVGFLRRQSVEGKLYATSVIGVSAKDTLDGRVAAENSGPSVLVLLIDTHHFESNVSDVYEVTNTTLQFLGLFFT